MTFIPTLLDHEQALIDLLFDDAQPWVLCKQYLTLEACQLKLRHGGGDYYLENSDGPDLHLSTLGKRKVWRAVVARIRRIHALRCQAQMLADANRLSSP